VPASEDGLVVAAPRRECPGRAARVVAVESAGGMGSLSAEQDPLLGGPSAASAAGAAEPPVVVATAAPVAATAAPPGTTGGAMPPPFLTKLFDLVSDTATDDLVSWTPEGTTFTVHKPNEFARDVLPQYFKHNNFSSFVRQLNQYGFHKQDPDRWTFGHKSFRRGYRDGLVGISRRRSSRVPIVLSDPSVAQAVAGSSADRDMRISSNPVVELGNFGGSTLDVLKRDRDRLLKALVATRIEETKLKSKCDSHERRIDALENNLKQMQSFIFHYFNQVIQNYSGAMRKRRRILPNEEVPAVGATATDPNATGDLGAADQMVLDASKALQIAGHAVASPEDAAPLGPEGDDSVTLPGTRLDVEKMRRIIRNRFSPNEVPQAAYPQASIEEVGSASEQTDIAPRGPVVSAAAALHLGELEGSGGAIGAGGVGAIGTGAGASGNNEISELALISTADEQGLEADLQTSDQELFDSLGVGPFPPLQELPSGTDIDLLTRQLEEFENAV